MSSSSAGAKGGRSSRKQGLSACIMGPGQAAAEINPEIRLNGKEEGITNVCHISPPAKQNQTQPLALFLQAASLKVTLERE